MTTIDLTDTPSTSRWWRPLAVWTGAVVVYGAVLWLQIHLPFWTALGSSAVYLYSLAILTYPARRRGWWSMSRGQTGLSYVARQVAIGAAIVGAWIVVELVHDRLTVGPRFWDVVYAQTWMFQLLFAVLVYCALVGLTVASDARVRERQRERREAELRIVAREAELSAIRAQFQPHFVLNALNSLLALIDSDPPLARTMVLRLADVMKGAFQRVDEPLVPLEREIDLVTAYLDIEQIRFGARLTVTFEIDDAARPLLVPAFILQPIVENAVKHGVAPHTRPGQIRITARLVEGHLELGVRDTGTGASATTGTGIGLPLTRRRLESVYGSGHALTMERGDTGTAVRIDVPIGVGDAG